MRKLITTLLSLFVALIGYAQQDPQIRQYLFNGIYINPAYAGYKENVYLHSFYRAQWAGVEGAPRTLSVSVDGAVKEGNVGLALMVTHDRVGAQKNSSAYANYAYRLKVGESDRLAFGLGAGVLQTVLDGKQLTTVTEDNYIPQRTESVINPDVRAGIFYSNPNIFAGFSVEHLLAQYTQKRQGQYINMPVTKPHYYLTAGAMIHLNDAFAIKPSFLLKDDMGGPTNLDLNALILLNNRFWIGAFYRTTVKLYNKPNLQNHLSQVNNVGLITELLAIGNIKVGYAFDYSLSKIAGYNYGSHEISLGLLLGKKYHNNNTNKGSMSDFPF